jgi:hypothetical protein
MDDSKSGFDSPKSVHVSQVLYSQFVALLDEGKVQAARLESGTSKLYFDVKFNEASTASTSEATESAAAEIVSKTKQDSAKASTASTSTAPTKSGVTVASTSTPQPTATTTSTSSSGAASTFAHKMQKQYFIKVRAIILPLRMVLVIQCSNFKCAQA